MQACLSHSQIKMVHLPAHTLHRYIPWPLIFFLLLCPLRPSSMPLEYFKLYFPHICANEAQVHRFVPSFSPYSISKLK